MCFESLIWCILVIQGGGGGDGGDGDGDYDDDGNDCDDGDVYPGTVLGDVGGEGQSLAL